MRRAGAIGILGRRMFRRRKRLVRVHPFSSTARLGLASPRLLYVLSLGRDLEAIRVALSEEGVDYITS